MSGCQGRTVCSILLQLQSQLPLVLSLTTSFHETCPIWRPYHLSTIKTTLSTDLSSPVTTPQFLSLSITSIPSSLLIIFSCSCNKYFLCILVNFSST